MDSVAATRKLIGGLVILATMAGCSQPKEAATADPARGSASTSAATPTPAGGSLATPTPAGGSRFTAGNFSMELPPDWKVIDLTAKDWEGILTKVATEPAYKDMVAQVKKVASNGTFKMFALGPAANNFVQNLSVSQDNAGATITADQLKPELAQQLASIADGPVDANPVTLPAGGALRYNYSVKPQTPHGPSVSTVGFIIIQGTNLTTITFSCLAADKPKMIEFADKTVQSFQFKN